MNMTEDSEEKLYKELSVVNLIDGLRDMNPTLEAAYMYAVAQKLILEKHREHFLRGVEVTDKAIQLSSSVLIHQDKELAVRGPEDMWTAVKQYNGLLFADPTNQSTLFIARVLN